jgi:hypothetical protein
VSALSFLPDLAMSESVHLFLDPGRLLAAYDRTRLIVKSLGRPARMQAGAEGREGSAWGAWVRPLLVSALAAAPLDLGDLWAVTLRYGLYGLLRARDARALEALLGVVSAPAQDGALLGACLLVSTCFRPLKWLYGRSAAHWSLARPLSGACMHGICRRGKHA